MGDKDKDKGKREDSSKVGVPPDLARQFLKDLQAAHDKMHEKEKEGKKK